ncbi:MAG: hypothetical protein WDN46_08105 [Methylocella sp.]
MIKPLRVAKDRTIAAMQPKRVDPFYSSPLWAKTRQKVFERDCYTCTVKGCGRPAKFVDHGRARRWGGADDMSNLRSLCDCHDRMFKERPDGSRKTEG